MITMSRLFRIAAALGGFFAATMPEVAFSADVTYYRDVLPILREYCHSCHRPADNVSYVAPMPLMTYEEARPWAAAIARRVQAREMPPWFAEQPVGVFSNERRLSEKEIGTIVAWVRAGAPAGDRADTPLPRRLEGDANAGWTLGRPDLVVRMPEAFVMSDDLYDAGMTFYTPLTAAELPESTWLRGWELRPGVDGHIVHHMCVGVLQPGESARADGLTADERGQLGCIAAGAEAAMLPEGFGIWLQKGATIRFNMHYHKRPGPGTSASNVAEVGLFVSKEPVKYAVTSDAIGNFGFEIPPNRSNYRIGAGRVLQADTWLLSLWPHAHLRATAARYTVTYPDGREELLLDVPRYDQSWQVTYLYSRPKLLPKGTMIDVSFWYDNTSARGARRGFTSTRAVVNGPRTNDEMALGFITYAEAP